MLTAIFITGNKAFNFKKVENISIDETYTTIGYYDDDGIYHEETGDTPKTILINNEEDKQHGKTDSESGNVASKVS